MKSNRRNFFLMGLCALILSQANTAFADGCTTLGFSKGASHFGKTNCSHVKQARLKIFGLANVQTATLDELTVHGNADLQSVTTNTLSVYGNTVGKKISCTKQCGLHGNGRFNATSLATLTMYGDLFLTNHSKLGDLHLSGKLSADETTFTSNLDITSDAIRLTHSTIAGNITIHPNSDSRSQVLCLSKKTTITGNVTFLKPGGVVYQFGQSNIKGTLSGAKLIKQPCPLN